MTPVIRFGIKDYINLSDLEKVEESSLSLDSPKNNSDIYPISGGLDPEVCIIGIPECCPILNDSTLMESELKTGVRERFPRNDFCSNCDLESCVYYQKIANFQTWLNTSKWRVIVIAFQDENGEEHRKILPAKIRFSPRYFSSLRSNFYSIIPYLTESYSVMFFLTLTVNPTWDLPSLFDNVSKRFDRLIDILRKRLSRSGIKMDYIKVYEPTKKGIIHVHVVFFLTKFPMKGGRVFLIGKKELDELWGLGHTWLGWENKGRKMIWLPLKGGGGSRNVKIALNYILKYITKAHDNLLFASLIHSSGRGGGKRSWTTSRQISAWLSDKEFPKTGVVIFVGFYWNLPDWALPAEFYGDLVFDTKQLEQLLVKWWGDNG